jgi:hypothetical protein
VDKLQTLWGALMEWYWYLVIAIAAVVLLRWLMKSGEPTKAHRDATETDEIRALFVQGRQSRAREELQERLKPELKPYVTRLCQVHATVGSFASPDTRIIGQEIYDKHGHDSMVAVCDNIRRILGGGPARDLEYKWGGVGDWMG